MFLGYIGKRESVSGRVPTKVDWFVILPIERLLRALVFPLSGLDPNLGCRGFLCLSSDGYIIINSILIHFNQQL